MESTAQNPEENWTTIQKNKIPKKGGKIIFIIPFMFISSGKSFAAKLIKQMVESTPNWTYASVSSDEIRGEES